MRSYDLTDLSSLAPFPAAVLVVAMLSGLLFTGCGEGGAFGSGGADVSAASGDIVSGEELYADNCASCHGASAQGGSGPGLAGISDSNGVVDIILYGDGGMPGFSDTLNDADISDILAYLGDL